MIDTLVDSADSRSNECKNLINDSIPSSQYPSLCGIVPVTWCYINNY